MTVQLAGMNAVLNQLNSTASNRNLDPIKQRAIQKGADYLRKKIAENTDKSTVAKRHAADNVVIQQVDDSFVVGYAEEFFYMMFQEFGTSKISANPVVQRTFEQEIGNAQNIMIAELRRGLGL